MTPELFDDIRICMYHLKHSCANIRTVKRAIEIIVSKTNIPEQRVIDALAYIGKA